MSLTPGTRLGVYEIRSSIGAGGMGEVYRARDTRLDRDVALKVLPEAFAHDAERLARFEREAKTLAALNHPHIAHIHGIEETSGTVALVMELVEGEDLSQRLARGAIPLDEALPIARQILEALEAAHEQGIVHRDLKPGNIKLRPDGSIKVLDFGLAKAMERLEGDGFSRRQAEAEASALQTITSPALTMRGVILGTAAYMSPEQASGKPVDKRSDLWSFGVVLFEMLTGRPLFAGETVSHVLASVLKDSPPLEALPVDTPAAVRRLLRRCLERDRKKRLTDAGAARLDIDDALMPESEAPTPRKRGFAGQYLAWTIAAVALALVGLSVVSGSFSANDSAAPLRTLQLDKGAGIDAPKVSPDGQSVVYVRDGRVVVRRLDEVEGREIGNATDAASPFWSMDPGHADWSSSDRSPIGVG